MNIQYCSDLHLEFPKNKKFLDENPIIPNGDILILAGDIIPFNIMDKHMDFFKFCSDNFKETYWIAGNHEYYGFDISQKSGAFHEKIKSNVHLLNNTTIEVDDTQLIFTTLWSKINSIHQLQIENGMNDFHAIRYGKDRFTSEVFNDLHQENLLFLNKALKDNALKNSIVVSHHVPTFQNYPQQYSESLLTEAFAVELSDLIEEYNLDYWIYGHHHENIPEFKIHETTLLTNQLGYVELGENKYFDSEKIIKL